MAPSSKEDVVAAIDILGSLAAVCFALLLAPQIYLNHKRRSTDGLSLLLVLLWHAAALLYLPFLIQHKAPLPLMAQWVVFSVASVILELQFLAFRHNSGSSSSSSTATAAPVAIDAETEEPPITPPRPPAPSSSAAEGIEAGGSTGSNVSSISSSSTPPPAPASALALLVLGLGSAAASALGVIGLLYLFRASPPWLADSVGSAFCSVLLAVGFLPQLQLMCTSKTSEGFSLGLSALDLTGSSLSIVALLLVPMAAPSTPVDVGGIVPYAVIVGFQVRRQRALL
jgi:uncharacterized protein with PQ loop repeat